MKTSVSDPINIEYVAIGVELGRIGITFCPGKYDPDGGSGSWDRDLILDLDAIYDSGAAAIVTLLEPREFELLRVEQLG